MRGHKHECKNLRSAGDRDIPKAVLGCMELLVRKKHGLIPEQEWDILCRLDTHVEDFRRNGKYGGIELMAMGTSQFSFTQDTFDKDFVAAMYARILSNSLTLITPTFDPLGIMVDPIFCHLNHSCDPNAYLVMDGPEIALHALRDIKMDEEIFISYIDPTNPFSRRQHELKERWFFGCRCGKCEKGPTEQEDVFLVNPKEAPQKCKAYADSLLERTESPANDPANHIGESLDEKRIAALQGEFFNAYEEQQRTGDVKHAIKICQNAMELCASSDLWPPHRQPLPALRDDLIVHLLADGQYELAWSHCAKRHRYTTPKLFPQPHHPIRVVQTWQMAMLAQYLASTGKELAPGTDMAMITVVLIISVHAAARRSHGEYSAFFKSVQGKFAEVESEVLAKFGGRDALEAATKVQEKRLWEMGDWQTY